MIKQIDEIQEHFEKWYPREGCGVLAVVKGKMKWFPCDNVAEEDNDFVIDSKQYIDIGHKADIVGIVHSHPDASTEPSENDIKYCNTIGIPYYIFSYPEMELNIIKPKRDIKSLFGREYEFGINDCFEAMRDYLASQDIVIPSRAAFEDDWWEKNLDYFTDEIIKDYGYTRVEGNMQKNDVIIFKINATVGNHCGVYLGDDIFYHHAENRISCRENIYPFWKRHISGVYRHAA
jgi:proteasome lid subunit RPN8/RPN11